MKVTRRRLLIASYWHTFKTLPLLMKIAWLKVCIVRLEFYNRTMEAWLKNPNIKWR